ncbi:transglycosylase SLT domain-containing protein [Megasphaera sueciensis]|uniref:transglycosylase SLT domain-containing protein n=1 Tax=Megasphaera sueciensis TaxID=349094 RepID=UPI003D024D4C
MISEVIQEYLVKLGADIDKQQFNNLDRQLNDTDKKVASTTGSMSNSFEKSGAAIVKTTAKTGKEVITTTKDVGMTMVHVTEDVVSMFMKASVTLGTIFASVSMASAKMMKSITDQDLQMQTFANRMMMTKEAAWQMKKATDALGASVGDIIINPELMERYKALVDDSHKMMPSGDFETAMKGFRDLTFEVTRFRQEVSFGMQWTAYYIIKGLVGPLDAAKIKAKGFNDYIISNMQQIAQRIANAIIYVVHVVEEFWSMVKQVKATLWDFWESFPSGVKMAIEALGSLWIVFRASPIEKMVALFGLLFHAANGGSMDDLKGTINGIKNTVVDMVHVVEPYITAFVNVLTWGAEKVIQLFFALLPIIEKLGSAVIWLVDKFMEFVDGVMPDITSGLSKLSQSISDVIRYVESLISTIKQSEEFKDFMILVDSLWFAFKHLASGVISYVSNGIKNFMDGMKNTGDGISFRNMLHSLWKIFIQLGHAISYVINMVAGWLDELSRSPEVIEFMRSVGELARAVMDLFVSIMRLISIAFPSLFKGLNNRKPTNSFTYALRGIANILTYITKAITFLIKKLTELFDTVSKNHKFVEFWKEVGKIMGDIFGITGQVLHRIGLLAQAIKELLNKNYIKAYNLAKAAFSTDGTPSGLPMEAQQYEGAIQKYSKEQGVDPNLLRAVIKNESNFDQSVISPAGAIGLSQLMPGTASELGVNPYDADDNIRGGAMYLRKMLDAAGGDETLAIQMYNAGPGNPGGADMAYVDRVMSDRIGWAQQIGISRTSSSDIPQQGGVDLADVNPKLLQYTDSFISDLRAEGYDAVVSSGYRSPEHSLAIGGYADDPHTQGRAIDFVINGNYNPDDIVAAAAARGLSLTYHDAGSGYHFHTQLASGDPDDVSPGGIGNGGGDTGVGMPSMGQMVNSGRKGLGVLTQAAMGVLQELCAQVDPTVLSSVMAGNTNSYGGSSITIQVGDIYVTKSNASADDVKEAVLGTMEERARYFLESRTLSGSPELK